MFVAGVCVSHLESRKIFMPDHGGIQTVATEVGLHTSFLTCSCIYLIPSLDVIVRYISIMVNGCH